MVNSGTKGTYFVWAFGICMTWYMQRWPPDEVKERIDHSGIHFKPSFPPPLALPLPIFWPIILSAQGPKERLWSKLSEYQNIRERLSAISNIWIQNAPYYSLSVTLFCDLKRSQKCVTLPSIEGKLRLEVQSWMIDFLLYCNRGPFLPIPCHTYSESLDWSRSFDPHSDLIIGQKIGKGNAKGGGKPWVEVYS